MHPIKFEKKIMKIQKRENIINFMMIWSFLVEESKLSERRNVKYFVIFN